MSDNRYEYDPRFPERPLTTEFWRLSQLIHEMDSVEDIPGLFEKYTTGELIEATQYLAKGRGFLLQERAGFIPKHQFWGLLYHDAFILGREYEKRYGSGTEPS